ncbi:major facilitator superfamily MFS_1 [Allomeiothermus silvanus DSM 9946]|uniref:Major facilitator superfamily MFS_1 n=1 Tax=Allomeiothermus silvanus (strain ATCC 700542 / DSM 9946 / NBRC 106475 / NCIMB 13440 / VI-R2) TaxID=526227 RepID=D7BCT6_ALLS1|nr:YbfB/YjiJ family MFS transporter [Allomeiothermus silvanus]ADH64669.1 major facilitator superfamily MFS_1 [Allomeiothermus silvanus DSM 9946]
MSLLRVALGLALGPAVALGFARFAYALVLPAMREDLHWSYAQAGGMNTANAVGYLLGSLLANSAMLRWGYRSTFLGSLALTALALLFSGVSDNYFGLVALRLIAGVSGALVFVSGGALAAHLASRDPSRSALVLGVYFGGVGLGILASGVFLPVLLEDRSGAWPWAWMALGLLSVVGFGGAYLAARRVEEPRPAVVGSEGGSLGSLLPTAVAYFLFALGYIVYMTFVIAFVRAELGTLEVTLFWSVLGIAVVGGGRIWGGRIQKSRDGSALSLILFTISAGAALPLLSKAFLLMLGSALLFGSFLSVVTAITALVRQALPPAQWGYGIAVFTVIFAAGQSLGPWLSGLLTDALGSLQAGFAASVGVLVLGGLVARVQRPT